MKMVQDMKVETDSIKKPKKIKEAGMKTLGI